MNRFLKIKITGSCKDDEIAVYGNNNTIDLGFGSDKLKVVGYNNVIKNTETVTSKQDDM